MKKHSGQFRRLTALALALCMLAALTAELFAADIVDSGYCGGEGDGTNLTWTLDSAGTLTISGHGMMENYVYDEFALPRWKKEPPWHKSRYTYDRFIFGEGVTSIGDYAFYGLKRLKENVRFPSSLTSVGAHAFDNCQGLTGDLYIPDNVTYIGEYAFYNCTGLNGNLHIPESLVRIGCSAFQSCKQLTGTLSIPAGVTYIGAGAFSQCKSLTGNLNIPEGITDIAENTFQGCSGLTGKVNIPNSVTKIGDGAFASCNFTGTLQLPQGLTSIGANAFFFNNGLTGSLNIPKSVKSIGYGAFELCSGFTGDLIIPKNITKIEDHTFGYCSGFDGELVLPEQLTRIGAYAFAQCSGLTGDLVLPDKVTEVEDHAFWDCTGFTGELKIPSGVSDIGASAFEYCSGLSGNLTLSDKLVFIGENAFFMCSGLAGDMLVPEHVAEISSMAFFGCNIANAFFLGDAPTVQKSGIGYGSFPRDITLHYIDGSTGWIDSDAYDAVTSTWNGYKLETWVPSVKDDDPQFISRTPEPNHYLIDGTFKESPTITMKFNREVESVQAGGSSGDFKVVKGTYDETVYSLAAGNHAVTDVSVDGKTVSIHLSDANLLIGEKYSILMDYGVIKFKNTDKKIGVSGTSWTFRYSPLDDGKGFTLRKNNNHFLNSNKTGQAEPYDDLMGFIGIDSYALPIEYYNTLMRYASNAVERSKITYTILSLDWSGSCHGISSTMLLALEGKLKLSQFESGVSQYYDMPNPYKNKIFLNLIQYFQVGQLIGNGQSTSNDSISLTAGNLIAALNTRPVLLSTHGAGWGHAILALNYKVDKQGNYTVLLYDMNSLYPYSDSAYDFTFTRMDIAKDFKTFAVYDNEGKKIDVDNVGYLTVDDINRINPFAPAASTVQTQSQETAAASDCVDITVPLSAVSYRIQNAEGQTLVCDENGDFSGTMEILNQRGFFSGAADGSGSSWTLTVPASERFEVENDQSGINVGIYTEQGCLVLESEDIRSATFVTNQFIRFEQEGQQKFTCVLSNDLPDDQTVRMAYASAETTGSTQIGLEAGDLLISADETTLDEAARYVGLEKTELDNISADDGVIYVPVFSDTEDTDQKITVSLGSMTTVLSAKHTLTGQVCVAGYRENGQLCSVKLYPAAEKITASVDAGAVRAKIFWLDDNRPVCAAKTILLK